MDLVYPVGPADVPPSLTAASTRYRRHAWFALAGLVLFIAVYFALAGWFGWTAFRLLAGLGHTRDEGLGLFVAGVGAAFLSAFMIKALFFVKRGEAVEDREVTDSDEPQLFAFLNRLADEIGAPRPHRVYLSGRVNAAVFYDLSVANLIVASKKNLEIGLPLVNVLSLGELKAVLAHEFGHFAQKSMAVGRWVYISQQIASHIVARRDAFDAFLAKLSRFDVRVAWIGWVLRLIVWSIRAVIDLLFRLVVLAQRALSREMEFQADLVSVSVTGSDALIHALHRLGPAESAWSRALAFASAELAAKRAVADLFAIQTRVIERVRTILDDEDYGVAPVIPAAEAPQHRVFKTALAAPPAMWSTHPSNRDREDNAKRLYVPALIDGRSAWSMFADPPVLRRQVTERLARTTEFTPVPIEQSLERLDTEFRHAYFDRAYRGTYLNRSIVRCAATVDDLYAPAPPDVLKALDGLYPPSLETDYSRLRELEEEKRLLEGLQNGALSVAGGVIRHRGEVLTKRKLPDAIGRVRREIDALTDRVRSHDRICRATHRAAADGLDRSWAGYLAAELRLHHYAEHAGANLRDARAALGATFRKATAAGKVRKQGREAILRAADATYAALKAVHDQAGEVVLDPNVAARLGQASWKALLEELKLPPPTPANLGNWLNAVDSWVNAALSPLESLRLASLEELLMTEAAVKSSVRDGRSLAAAPTAPQPPASYVTLLPGAERPKETELGWWDRFQVASGILPMAARVLAAATIIGLVIWVGVITGNSSIFVFNGLGRMVNVEVGAERVVMSPFSHREIGVGDRNNVHVTTRTVNGQLIEQFDETLPGHASHVVYNVASAGVLVSWVAVYGQGAVPAPTSLGAPRWVSTQADVVLDDPPRSVQTKGGSATRSVLSGLAAQEPERVLAPLGNHTAEIDRVIAEHARWDDGGAASARAWLSLAAKRLPTFGEIVAARLRAEPASAFNLELEQATTAAADRDSMCSRQRALAASNPRDKRLQSVVAACGGGAPRP